MEVGQFKTEELASKTDPFPTRRRSRQGSRRPRWRARRKTTIAASSRNTESQGRRQGEERQEKGARECGDQPYLLSDPLQPPPTDCLLSGPLQPPPTDCLLSGPLEPPTDCLLSDHFEPPTACLLSGPLQPPPTDCLLSGRLEELLEDIDPSKACTEKANACQQTANARRRRQPPAGEIFPVSQ